MNPAEHRPDDRDLESLSRLLDGDLDDQERRALERRLDTDADLRSLLDLLRLAARAAGTPVPPPPPSVLDDQIHLALQASSDGDRAPVVRHRQRHRTRLLVLSAAAITLIAGLVAGGAIPAARREQPSTVEQATTDERGVAGQVALAAEKSAPPSFDDVEALMAHLRAGGDAEPARIAPVDPITSASVAADARATAAVPTSATADRFDPGCGSDLAEPAIVAGRPVRWGIRVDRPSGGARLVVVDTSTCAVLADRPG